MKRTLMGFLLLFPLAVFSQNNLSGLWRLKDSKITRGADYVNAIPVSMSIRQTDNTIEIEVTNSLGNEKDTTYKQVFTFGEERSVTKTGKKKIVSLQQKEKNIWAKQTEIFTLEDSTKRQSIDKESYTVYAESQTLSLIRDYDTNDQNSEDFVIIGKYEKISPQQLLSETARGKGVKFTEGLTWEQIKAKARKERKYIFVDCYATWCGPCKVMDKYVYPLNMVGEAMNDKFISVKVQLDSLKTDEPSIKKLYSLARKFEKEYNINSLPTYLFFSPEGKALHKAVGKQDPKDFIKMLEAAKDPEVQLYTLFEKAKNKQLQWSEYPHVVYRLKKEFNEKGLAKQVAAIYYNDYLLKKSKMELLTKDNLDFVGENYNVVKPFDKLFVLCSQQPKLVDSVKEYEGGGWTEFIVDRSIAVNDIEPWIGQQRKTGKEPIWSQLDVSLSKKYGREKATTYVLGEKTGWYMMHKNWDSFLVYVKPFLSRLDLNKISPFYINDCAWNIFLYSKDTQLIKSASLWMDVVIGKTEGEDRVPFVDTKACLLYKMGKKEEGIDLMKEVIQLISEPDLKKYFQAKRNDMMENKEIWLTYN